MQADMVPEELRVLNDPQATARELSQWEWPEHETSKHTSRVTVTTRPHLLIVPLPKDQAFKQESMGAIPISTTTKCIAKKGASQKSRLSAMLYKHQKV